LGVVPAVEASYECDVDRCGVDGRDSDGRERIGRDHEQTHRGDYEDRQLRVVAHARFFQPGPCGLFKTKRAMVRTISVEMRP